MDCGVHGVAKSRTGLSNFHFLFFYEQEGTGCLISGQVRVWTTRTDFPLCLAGPGPSRGLSRHPVVSNGHRVWRAMAVVFLEYSSLPRSRTGDQVLLPGRESCCSWLGHWGESSRPSGSTAEAA